MCFLFVRLVLSPFVHTILLFESYSCIPNLLPPTLPTTSAKLSEHLTVEEFLGPIPDPLLNWITELSNVSASQRWVLLTNLKAATVYQFRVSAVNRVGEGSPSEPSNIIELPQEGE